MSDMNIGQKILVMRAEKGWTQQQLAEKLKTSQRTIVAWEAGDSVPRKAMRVKIAQVFGVPPNHFLDPESDETMKTKMKNDTTTDKTAREKGVLEDIENIVSSAYQEIDEKQKSRVLETIQGILATIEEK